MNINKLKSGFAMVMLLSLFSGNSAFAKPPGGENKKPPQEAIEACADKSENDAVSFTTRRGDELTATCQIRDEVLVAVPENGHEQADRN